MTLNPCSYCQTHGMALCPKHGLQRASKPKGKGNPLLRSKPIKQQSDKQAIRQAFLAGIKAERLRYQLVSLGDSKCEWCEKFMDVQGDADPTEQEWIEEAMGTLDAHHVQSRDKGRRYQGPQDHGIDSPTNIVLLCRSCHAETEPEPEWSKP